MKEVFEQYGGVLIATVVAVAMIALSRLLLPEIGKGIAIHAMTKESMQSSDRLTEVLAENGMNAEYIATVSQLVDIDVNSQIKLWDAKGDRREVHGLPSDIKNYDEPGIYNLYFSYEKPNGRRDYGCVKIPVQRKPMVEL